MERPVMIISSLVTSAIKYGSSRWLTFEAHPDRCIRVGCNGDRELIAPWSRVLVGWHAGRQAARVG